MDVEAIEGLLGTWGYLAVALGTFIEGEAVLVVASVLSRRGHLELHWVIASAFAGAASWDHLCYHLGRWRGNSILRRFDRWSARIGKVRASLDRHRILLVAGFRFLYGMRTIAPFVIGMARVPVWQFTLIEIASAATWACVWGFAGWLASGGAPEVIETARQVEILMLVAAGLLVLSMAGGRLVSRWIWREDDSR